MTVLRILFGAALRSLLRILTRLLVLIDNLRQIVEEILSCLLPLICMFYLAYLVLQITKVVPDLSNLDPSFFLRNLLLQKYFQVSEYSFIEILMLV